MSNWKQIRFRDFIKLNRGFDLPNDKMEQGDYPVVASTNIKGFHSQYKIEPPCIVTGRSGSLGTVQYIDKQCTPLNTTLYVKDFKNNNAKFVYYYLKTMHLEQFNSGAGVPTLNQNHLHSYGVKVPNLPTQKRIADILSAYDDLLENNNKRIKVLEKMAENLYKEWFVRFRFPGYETAEFENGIPKGWEVVKLGHLCDITTGKKDANEASGIGQYPFFTCARETNLYTNEFLLDEEAILVSGNGSYTGFVKKYSGKFDLYQRTYALYNFKNIEWLYLYQVMKTNFEKKFMGGSTGSAIPYITKPDLYNYKLLLPAYKIMKKANSIFVDINNQVASLELINQNLIKQRDLLLPRLMSGKLEV